MKAVFYNPKPLGWVLCKCLRRLWRGCLLSRMNGLALRDVAAPELPAPDWLRLRTLLGGICGSDLAVIAQKQPANSILQSFSSMPMILGHENVARVEEVGPGVDPAWKTKRVCVEPTLACGARGIDPPCERCQQGEFGACENFGASGEGTAGLPAGTSIGYNSRTGGSFGEYFVAHRSQLVEVPDGVSDEQAVLADPVACGLHAALRADLSAAGHVLVYGTGPLGLGLIAALRAIGYAGRIDALTRREYLATLARQMGADEILDLPRRRKKRFERIARQTSGAVLRQRFADYMLSGGYDVVFDCVGAAESIDEGLKWTRSRGQFIMVGTGHGGGVDLTPIWFRELTVVGASGRQLEHVAGRRIGTYELVFELMAAGKLHVEGLLTHTFPLAEYRKAFAVGMNKAAHRAVKVVFDFR